MPEPKDARRLIPDPEHEPDFYAVRRTHPLPGDRVPEQIVAQVSPLSPREASRASVDALVSRPGSILGARPASEVAWLAQQLPPAKRLAPLEAQGVVLDQKPPVAPSLAALLASQSHMLGGGATTQLQPTQAVDPAFLERARANLRAQSLLQQLQQQQQLLKQEQLRAQLNHTSSQRAEAGSIAEWLRQQSSKR